MAYNTDLKETETIVSVPRSRRPLSLVYGVAVLSSAVALLARVLLTPYIQAKYPFTTFFLAVMITAWYGGLGPGLLAAALGYLGAAFFIPPYHNLVPHDTSDYIGAGIFLFVSVCSALLSESQHKAQTRADTNAEEANR